MEKNILDRTYFVLVNYKTKEKYLCSWFENDSHFHGQKICYIGINGGLGGYNYMIQRGFIDRRFIKFRPSSHAPRIINYYIKKLKQYENNSKLYQSIKTLL